MTVVEILTKNVCFNNVTQLSGVVLVSSCQNVNSMMKRTVEMQILCSGQFIEQKLGTETLNSWMCAFKCLEVKLSPVAPCCTLGTF